MYSIVCLPLNSCSVSGLKKLLNLSEEVWVLKSLIFCTLLPSEVVRVQKHVQVVVASCVEICFFNTATPV